MLTSLQVFLLISTEKSKMPTRRSCATTLVVLVLVALSLARYNHGKKPTSALRLDTPWFHLVTETLWRTERSRKRMSRTWFAEALVGQQWRFRCQAKALVEARQKEYARGGCKKEQSTSILGGGAGFDCGPVPDSGKRTWRANWSPAWVRVLKGFPFFIRAMHKIVIVRTWNWIKCVETRCVETRSSSLLNIGKVKLKM